MEISQAINTLINGNNLSEKEMETVMNTIMTGKATDAQIGGFLIALRMKGETIEEITAAAKVMRDLSTKVQVNAKHLVDTCGTGGDGKNTFNISTCTAFVAAAAGCHVAKHGNRSVSSSCGSADVLEAAGVNLSLSPEQLARAIEDVGVGFMFAPAHHGAMKYAIGPRKEMAVRTIFNVLGPLTNPASAPNQMMGVFSKDLLVPLAQVFKNLGSKHVLLVHSKDGMDEISIADESDIVELKDGDILEYTIKPEDFSIPRSDLSSLMVQSSQESLQIIQDVLSNKEGPARDIVILNGGAAIYAANVTETLAQGVEMAKDVISSGQAKEKLKELIEFSQNC